VWAADTERMSPCFPTGSRVRFVGRNARTLFGDREGRVVGCYAYEEPVYVVRTSGGLVEAPADRLELVEGCERARRQLWFAPAA